MTKRRLYKVNEPFAYDVCDLVDNNKFINAETEEAELPVYENIKDELPKPVWDGHDSVIDCYYKAWEIGFGNIKKAKKEAGFVSNFIDTAFNGFLFMWDSAFITMFGKYGNHIFNFQKTMDNIYAHQHKDGFICREICEDEDGEMWHRDDPASTGPNVMPWCEWEYYKLTGDKERLEKVFWPLLAYQRWLRLNRTWPNGGYWTCGFACGMDNQPRVEKGYSCLSSHGHMTWIDACAQMIFSGKILIEMSKVIGAEDYTEELKDEIKLLTSLINDKMWSEKDKYYFDLLRDERSGNAKTIGAYWTLLADIVPDNRVDDFVAHLDNEKEFKRPHRVPSLSADHPLYNGETGEYWRGGVWAPTNYMVLKSLEKYGYDKMAYDIALSHVDNVVRVFENTGTLWENYSPELVREGKPARKDFIGWTGLSIISVLFEYVLGIRSDSEKKEVIWNLNRTEKHGIEKYPFLGGLVDLVCEERKTNDEKPIVKIESDVEFKLILRYGKNTEEIFVKPNK